MTNQEYTKEVLRIAEKYDYSNYMFWRVEEDVRFFVICSDTFAYACADLEEINPGDLELFEECLKANDLIGTYLFAAAKRKQMPIKEFFKNESKEVKELFNKYVNK